MSNQPQIFSPLTQKEKIASDNISLELIDFLGKINVRLKEDDVQARDAVEKYLTYKLPKSAGEVTGNNETRVLWLGPNEYLLLSEDEKKDNVINGLREILSDLFCAITDVSDYYLTMRLSGPKSIEVLTKACPLNFDQYLTKGNSCAQSYISKATVLIDRLSDDLVFDILVRWSFADYLWDWLADSSNEFILSEK